MKSEEKERLLEKKRSALYLRIYSILLFAVILVLIGIGYMSQVQTAKEIKQHQEVNNSQKLTINESISTIKNLQTERDSLREEVTGLKDAAMELEVLKQQIQAANERISELEAGYAELMSEAQYSEQELSRMQGIVQIGRAHV